MYNPDFTVYNPCCTVYNLECTVYNPYCALYNPYYMVYNPDYTLYNQDCALYNPDCTVYNPDCRVYRVTCSCCLAARVIAPTLSAIVRKELQVYYWGPACRKGIGLVSSREQICLSPKVQNVSVLSHNFRPYNFNINLSSFPILEI